MEEQDVISFPYPTTPLDEEGYPTQEGLDYIKNWSMNWTKEGTVNFGQYFRLQNFDDLIAYLKLIWYYDDAIVYEDGLLEIHTLGWSGNESIIDELKQTSLWMFKHRATQTGGHYYFRTDTSSGMDYQVVKRPSKY